MRDEVLEPVDVSAPDNAKRRALSFIEKAFDEADAEGVPVDATAHAALFAGLTTLVDCFGEEQVSRLVAEIAEKVATGGYTINRILQ